MEPIGAWVPLDTCANASRTLKDAEECDRLQYNAGMWCNCRITFISIEHVCLYRKAVYYLPSSYYFSDTCISRSIIHATLTAAYTLAIKKCIESYDTAYSDCLKRGANMCLSPQQDFTMNYTYTMHLSIVWWPPTMQQLIVTSFLHNIYCSERLEYFCILKSCWRWSCASDGLRSSVTDRYLFLNYICLSLCLLLMHDLF